MSGEKERAHDDTYCYYTTSFRIPDSNCEQSTNSLSLSTTQNSHDTHFSPIISFPSFLPSCFRACFSHPIPSYHPHTSQPQAFPSQNTTGPFLNTYAQGPLLGYGLRVARCTWTVVGGRVCVTACPCTVLVGPVTVAVTVWKVVATRVAVPPSSVLIAVVGCVLTAVVVWTSVEANVDCAVVV